MIKRSASIVARNGNLWFFFWTTQGKIVSASHARVVKTADIALAANRWPGDRWSLRYFQYDAENANEGAPIRRDGRPDQPPA